MKTLNLQRLLIVLISALGVATSCRNEANDNASEGMADSVTAAPTEMPTGIPPTTPSLPYTAVFNDETDQLDAKANPDFDPSKLNIDTLTQLLSLSYPQIKLEVDRVSNDTAYVQITDAEYLTQQMGSSGATMYLMEVTYAFTELPAIHVVYFDFSEGDHAIPGAYTRQRFTETGPR